MKNNLKEAIEFIAQNMPPQFYGGKYRQQAIARCMIEYAKAALPQADVSGMLPINDAQIRAYGLLQLIAKAEMSEPSPYSPENDIRKRNIASWKQEYYSLIGNLR